MMYKAWSSIEEVPYWFSRSCIEFQGHTDKKASIVTQIGLHFEFTNGYEMVHKAWSSIEEVLYYFSYVKLQGHTGIKNVKFDLNWAFPDYNSSFNAPMATKWWTQLEVALKRSPNVFQGHSSNFKVTRIKKHRFGPKLGVSGL